MELALGFAMAILSMTGIPLGAAMGWGLNFLSEKRKEERKCHR